MPDAAPDPAGHGILGEAAAVRAGDALLHALAAGGDLKQAPLGERTHTAVLRLVQASPPFRPAKAQRTPHVDRGTEPPCVVLVRSSAAFALRPRAWDGQRQWGVHASHVVSLRRCRLAGRIPERPRARHVHL